MSPTNTVSQHIAKVKNFALQLIDVGENLPDSQVMAKIIASLPAKYRNFRTTWSSIDPNRQKIDFLQARLIEEEEFLKIEDDEQTALAAATWKVNKSADGSRTKKKHNKNRKFKKDLECYVCGAKGHFARECPKRKQTFTREDTENCAIVAFLERGASTHESGENDPTCLSFWESSNRKDDVFVATKRKSALRHEAGSLTPDRGNTNTLSSQQISELMGADQKDIWYTDSGASAHITFRREWLVDYRPRRDGSTITLGNDAEVAVHGEGTVLIERLVEGVWKKARIEGVLFVPEMGKNLYSVGLGTNRGLDFLYRGDEVNLLRESEVIATGWKQSNLIYRLFIRVTTNQVGVANIATASLRTWHERLGHLNLRALRDLTSKSSINGVKVHGTQDFVCEDCQLGKSHRLPFRQEVESCTRLGEMIHSDVCGPMPTTYLGGARFFVLFKGDSSGFRRVYFVKHKADVVECFIAFEREVKNKFG